MNDQGFSLSDERRRREITDLNLSTTSLEAPKQGVGKHKHRGAWLRTMIQWHWVSSALSLAGMFLFSITGITLNHAGQIESKPMVVNKTAEVPRSLLDVPRDPADGESAPLPPELADWLGERLGVAVGAGPAEWSDDEIYLSMPGPGVDAWLTIDRTSGEVEFESSDRGWIAYFNDLHKGRHTGAAWKWFLDVFAAATLIFCLTGLYLLYFHARHRPMTWPVVAAGVLIPVILAALIGGHP